MNPFHILDLTPGCTDAEVRTAYHRLLRKFPPEHFPSQFQMIQEASTLLRTERDRLRVQLTHHREEVCSPLQALEEFQSLPERMRPPGLAAFKALLQASATVARSLNP